MENEFFENNIFWKKNPRLYYLKSDESYTKNIPDGKTHMRP